MASVPFESLQGQPQRIFPVHDLDNGISYDQALRVTNAMQNQLHILERTSGNFPFPNLYRSTLTRRSVGTRPSSKRMR